MFGDDRRRRSKQFDEFGNTLYNIREVENELQHSL